MYTDTYCPSASPLTCVASRFTADNPLKCGALVASIAAALFAALLFLPSKAQAQDSFLELETNKNAAGYDRVGTTGRVFAEIGMGMTGMVVVAAPCVLLGLGGAAFMSEIALFGGAILFELAVTPVTAEFVYKGGNLTGGRGIRWPVYVGGYVGFVSGALLCLGAFGNDTMLYVGAIAAPVLSLVGSIVGYELSEKHETNHLRSLRDNSQKPSAPIMITLYSGSF